MKEHEASGEVIPPIQIHWALVAYPMCTYQCKTQDELQSHLNIAYKKKKCNLCEDIFETKEGLESHWTKNHPTFKPCRNMNDCSYGRKCMYSHEPMKKFFRCYQCGEEFNTRPYIMVDRKKEHEVDECRSFLEQGKCRYQDSCWWSHVNEVDPTTEAEGFWETQKNQAPSLRVATHQKRMYLWKVWKRIPRRRIL